MLQETFDGGAAEQPQLLQEYLNLGTSEKHKFTEQAEQYQRNPEKQKADKTAAGKRKREENLQRHPENLKPGIGTAAAATSKRKKISDNGTPTCITCKCEKDLSCFSKRHQKDGHPKPVCNECKST